MERRWVLKPLPDKNEVTALAKELKINPVLVNILMQRGIKTEKEAQRFFFPVLKDLHDPFLMKDMEKAVRRVEAAIEKNEKILIYGDYDVDGTTSVAMVYSFLKKRYTSLDYYIPDRDAEGYGISYRGIDYAAQKQASLIIALDCGIKENDKIKYANERGIDVIICDHHNPGSSLPDAVAVLDPKREDCSYPYKELSGCGVGFKFLHAYCIKNNIPFSELEKLLDLVAVSIASDIVPITGENRILEHYGLKRLNTEPSVGLKSIIKTAGLEEHEICVNDVVFKIGPRINAAGRIDYGRKSVELLICEDPYAAEVFSQKINKFNNTRKELDNSITEEIIKDIRRNLDLQNKKTTVVFNPKWHKGVLGIVASRLTESYYRPTIVLTESNGFATGSARSVEGFDLYSAVNACGDLLENFGGHMYAAGLTLKPENVRALQERFEEVVSASITQELCIPKVDIDLRLNLSEITSDFFNTLKKFEPFGPENMKPVFLTENVLDRGFGKKVGGSKEHLKLDVVENEDYENSFPSIGFQLSNHYNTISGDNPFSICYTVEENVFMGKTNLQLVLRDIKA
ncbi:MAG: single-stranded-DNA-specific exonuclease RecJ [Bacteroidia bacterium]|nr:single-stranded-DNA-specific exonuclease RecJ [Bacteroidia bacterium]